MSDENNNHFSAENDLPIVKDAEVLEEELERRRLLIEVIAKSLKAFTKATKKHKILAAGRKNTGDDQHNQYSETSEDESDS